MTESQPFREGQILTGSLFDEQMQTRGQPANSINVVIKVVMSPDPTRFPWHEVKKVDYYCLSVDALTQPMQVRERPEPYGEG
jgi:hypothetical protein